jgi:uncharacterized protein
MSGKPKIDFNKHLELTLLPTERCNFRCTYCYEDFLIGKMPVRVREALKKFIQRRIDMFGLETVTISWFGGEPLLAYSVVKDIGSFCKDQLDKGRLKIFKGNFTTNGSFLTPDKLAELCGMNQNFFQISIDGDRDGHDRSRKHASGAGTFDTIWANLVAAHESDLDFDIMIRLHIMPGNEESLYRFVERYVKDIGTDPRFQIFLREISNLGGPTGGTITYIDMKKAIAISDNLVNMFESAGVRLTNGVHNPYESIIPVIKTREEVESSDHDSDEPERYVCYASKPHHLLIRADGRIGKCTVDLDSPRNHVGTLQDDGTVSINDERMNFWLRGYVSGNSSELGCPAFAK